MSKPVNDADLDRIVTESGGVWVLRDSSDDGSVTVADLIAALREARAEVAFHMDGYEVIVQALIDHGGFPEVDGDGDEASIIADHVRGLALERDASQAALGEAVRVLRRHANVCSRSGEPTYLRETAARLDPSGGDHPGNMRCPRCRSTNVSCNGRKAPHHDHECHDCGHTVLPRADSLSPEES